MTKILSQKELRKLMQVHTTVKQAKQIIVRNTKALDVLRENKAETVKIGCPHCESDCKNCAYPYNKNTDFGEQCLTYKFGGLTYSNISDMILISPYEIRVEATQIEGSFSGRGYPIEELKKNSESWLQGHIEWAEAVIKKSKKKAKRRK